MIRRALFRGSRLRGHGSLAFQGTSNPVAKCPFTAALGEQKLESVATSTETAACPVLGVTPKLRCPIETQQCIKTLPTQQIIYQLGKIRLSAFVTATSVVGYVICGGASPVIASAVTVGTLLQCCSANTANQVIEVEHDKKMKRTCRRPLPMGYVTRTKASALSGAELFLGTGILYLVNPHVAALGVFNWLLYVAVYTPLKRVSAVNTWVGSIVGGIPPLMGGIAAVDAVTGPAWLLGALLVAWQIPHFMGLSFHCRRDYESAGYKMLAFYNPWRASFYAVLLSLAMAVMTLAGPSFIGMPVEGWFYPAMVIANFLMVYKAWLFHCDPKLHCRGCFVFSYMYLAITLAALILNHFEPVERFITTVECVTALLSSEDKESVSLG
ncbi:putative protoheme IX farnesyltransferase [Trypanosoma grayi]|uniref:putative protoheme IX farnesyltransferase n=1 Tax=Trypanosoma grayi TaxID=71804 RepID=UPI0004F44260|nr:putative protoheme IX farnesyltransferase [Trypanosoma grayi]KEG12319.1 putative protoheme IX farnesyltransferase [Trypanosoma grayi]